MHRSVASLSTLLVLLHALPAHAQFVVVRSARGVDPAVSRTALKGAFTGKLRAWKDNTVVTVITTPESSPAFGWLAATWFDVAPRTLATKIKQEVFKGEMNKPLAAATDAEVLQLLAATPGAVGVVSEEAARALPAGVVLLPVEP